MTTENEKTANVSNRVEPVVMRPIANWEELATVGASEHYYLEIEDGCGWIVPKLASDDVLGGREYLSTHTFYGRDHEHSTELLQKHGFNVVLANWDA